MSKTTVAQAKGYVRHNGGLQKGESLADALKRLPSVEEAFEESRMQSVLQGSRTCHRCSCHLFPPCQACVDCPICNPEDES